MQALNKHVLSFDLIPDVENEFNDSMINVEMEDPSKNDSATSSQLIIITGSIGGIAIFMLLIIFAMIGFKLRKCLRNDNINDQHDVGPGLEMINMAQPDVDDPSFVQIPL